MRVTSEFWVGALVRKAQSQGAFATVVHKGTPEAGAVFLIVNNQSGAFTVYAPAPQAFYGSDGDGGRLFEARLAAVAEEAVNELIDRERSFDPDVWVVEIEDQQGRSFLEDGELQAD